MHSLLLGTHSASFLVFAICKGTAVGLERWLRGQEPWLLFQKGRKEERKKERKKERKERKKERKEERKRSGALFCSVGMHGSRLLYTQ